MIPAEDYRNVTRWLDGCRRPLLISHQRPDGDALGALGALSLALRQRGCEPSVALFDPFPATYALLRATADWHSWESSAEKLASDCDALIIVDTCALAQLEPAVDFLARAPRTLVIDHHATRDPIATRAGDLRLIDETASAVCLMIAEWARAAGVRLDVTLAMALFTGIATDCGWFRFSNTDARTLRAAADLLAAGAQAQPLYAAIYQRESPAKLRLTGRMLQSLELHADGQLAVMYLRPADFKDSGADGTDTENLVNEAGRLASTEATILFIEHADGIRVNFRSKRSLDVSALARRFGGGGHARAAGARPKGRWEDVVPRVIAEAVSALAARPPGTKPQRQTSEPGAAGG